MCYYLPNQTLNSTLRYKNPYTDGPIEVGVVFHAVFFYFHFWNLDFRQKRRHLFVTIETVLNYIFHLLHNDDDYYLSKIEGSEPVTRIT